VRTRVFVCAVTVANLFNYYALAFTAAHTHNSAAPRSAWKDTTAATPHTHTHTHTLHHSQVQLKFPVAAATAAAAVTTSTAHYAHTRQWHRGWWWFKRITGIVSWNIKRTQQSRRRRQP